MKKMQKYAMTVEVLGNGVVNILKNGGGRVFMKAYEANNVIRWLWDNSPIIAELRNKESETLVESVAYWKARALEAESALSLIHI